MDLKAKLARLGAPSPPLIRPAPEERIAQLRQRIAEICSNAVRRGPFGRAKPSRFALSLELPGRTLETEHGPAHVVEGLYGPEYCHGKVEPARALTADGRAVAQFALDPTFAELDLGRALFLDTETTGLSGGTGTLPFVIGLAWFENGSLRLWQLVLRNPGAERPLLAVLSDRLQKASCLVSYNGKSFDWPLLRNRFVMNRFQPPPERPHLDLLHCTRRLFRRRLAHLRLTDIEDQLLGHCRDDDIHGSQIPELYFDYLRSGNGSLLAPVIEHNAKDVVALPALLGALAHRFSARAEELDPCDCLAFAQVAGRARAWEKARLLASRAAEGTTGLVRVQALGMVARLAERRGAVAEAVAALHQALGPEAPGCLQAALHLRLAKLYEHRLGEFSRALEHARASDSAESAVLHARRIARLERRGQHPPCAAA